MHLSAVRERLEAAILHVAAAVSGVRVRAKSPRKGAAKSKKKKGTKRGRAEVEDGDDTSIDAALPWRPEVYDAVMFAADLRQIWHNCRVFNGEVAWRVLCPCAVVVCL